MTSIKKSKSKKNNNSEERKSYFEKIWSNHYKGFVRDLVATGIVRDLVDFFVLPSIVDNDNREKYTPFSKDQFTSLIVAGSGFGKTTLLHIMLLCSLVDSRIVNECPFIKESIKEKEEKYTQLRNQLFGNADRLFFPVFIDSNNANTNKFSSNANTNKHSYILKLAEGSDMPSFFEMVEEANEEGTLLLLIDSIDEVESEKCCSYFKALNELLSEYENSRVVLTSRFSGKKDLPFIYDKLYINELKEDDIKKITFSILTESKANEFLIQYDKNAHLKSLARTPFALLTILENKGEYFIHQMIESMVNAIIDRRWSKYDYEINRENIKLLLGFLACAFVFGNREHVDIAEIRQIFTKAKNNLKLNRVSYDIPKQRLEYFLGTLSNQSGILNIEIREYKEEYIFQDNLVACWLAANYIYNIINESNEIYDRDGIHGSWSNMCWLDDFVRSFSEKKQILSSLAVYTLAMSLVLCSKTNGPDMQKMFLLYLVCRDATSINEEEQMNIAKGYQTLINNEFGENDLTNLPNGESRIIIDRMCGNNQEQSIPDISIIYKGEI